MSHPSIVVPATVTSVAPWTVSGYPAGTPVVLPFGQVPGLELGLGVGVGVGVGADVVGVGVGVAVGPGVAEEVGEGPVDGDPDGLGEAVSARCARLMQLFAHARSALV